MTPRRLGEREGAMPDAVDHRIDHVEDRLGRTEAGGDRQVAEFARALLIGEQVTATAKGVCAAPELSARLLEALRIGALEAIDGLLQVADREQGAVLLLALARAAEKLF